MKKKLTKDTIVMLLISLILVTLVGALGMSLLRKDNINNDTKKEVNVEEEAVVFEQVEEEAVVFEQMEIKNDNYTLLYPKRWENNLKIKVEDEKVKFVCVIGEEEYGLFTVYFSNKGEFDLGTIEEAGKEPMDISFTFASTELEDDMSEKNQMTFMGMQHDINKMIQWLEEDPSFVKRN